jgi:hypothetical protein
MNIPHEITFALRDPSVKAAWISDFPDEPGKCANCGGTGIIAAFIATEGPYDSPAHPYAKRGDVWLTSKTEVINGKMKYWVGQTMSVACPECQNTLAPSAVTPSHTYSAGNIKLQKD